MPENDNLAEAPEQGQAASVAVDEQKSTQTEAAGEDASFEELFREAKYGKDDEEPAEEPKPATPAPKPDKFGGDYSKAVQSYESLEQQLGKMGQEIGRLRQLEARFQGYVEAQGKPEASKPDATPEEQFYQRVNSDNPNPYEAVTLAAKAAISPEVARLQQELDSMKQIHRQTAMNGLWEQSVAKQENSDRASLDAILNENPELFQIAFRTGLDPYDLALRNSQQFDPRQMKSEAAKAAERAIADNVRKGKEATGPNLRSSGSPVSSPAPAILGKLAAKFGAVESSSKDPNSLEAIWKRNNPDG